MKASMSNDMERERFDLWFEAAKSDGLMYAADEDGAWITWQAARATPAPAEAQAVGYITPHGLKDLAEGFPQMVHLVAGHKHSVALFAAPPTAGAERWIPVSERLPEKYQPVAFVVDCKAAGWDDIDGRVLGGTYTGMFPGDFSVPGLTVKASHWMPLPDPPAAPSAPSDQQGGRG